MDNTTFQQMYEFFLSSITDDMFMEMTLEDTKKVLEDILLAALPHFEFPQWKDALNPDLVNKEFSAHLTFEEMKIISLYMTSEWIGYQLANVEVVRQKYSSSDFKFTSQAAHAKQLQEMKKSYEERGFDLQRLYSRRKVGKDGMIHSTMGRLAGRDD